MEEHMGKNLWRAGTILGLGAFGLSIGGIGIAVAGTAFAISGGAVGALFGGAVVALDKTLDVMLENIDLKTKKKGWF